MSQNHDPGSARMHAFTNWLNVRCLKRGVYVVSQGEGCGLAAATAATTATTATTTTYHPPTTTHHHPLPCYRASFTTTSEMAWC